MKFYIIFVIAALFTLNAQAHNTGKHEAAAGGPCWIWEIPTEPVYCIFVKGTRHQHPNPVVKTQ